MKILHFSLVSLLIIALLSCGTQKNIPGNYIQNTNDTTFSDTSWFPNLTIQKHDLLSIQVYSESIKPETDLPYNLANMGATTATGAAISGFLVDHQGNIDYPRIGKIHVEGLTKQQLADLIKNRFASADNPELTNPTVIVRLMNYRITVLGEVTRPGTFNVPTEKVTIFEALGMAGDIGVFGKKENVKIYRESDGKREVGVINLTSSDLFNSPYYNLKQNDVVMVEPTKSKAKQADQVTAQRISLALSIITSLAFIYNIFRSNN